MGCNCTKPPLMERQSEDLLGGDNLVEGDWSIIKQKKVKSHQNDIKSKVKKNLTNIIEKVITRILAISRIENIKKKVNNEEIN